MIHIKRIIIKNKIIFIYKKIDKNFSEGYSIGKTSENIDASKTRIPVTNEPMRIGRI